MNRMVHLPLWSLTASELTDGYRSGEFTPVEATQSILDRIDVVNPKVNAIVALDRVGSLQSARESSARWKSGGPLSVLDGVPISIKDNLLLQGLPATWGSRLLVDFVPDHDEPAIALLRAAGLVLFGKTNVPEFTIQGYTSNLVFGTTFNPHAPGKTPGGSTGGGAAAVAAGIGPLAIGTDGGGSIRRPAAHCGLFALKPSIGQIARYGGLPQILSDFEVIGLLGRSVDDLEALRTILAVPDPQDPRTLAGSPTSTPFSKAPRIAFMPAIGAHPVDPEIAKEIRSVANLLEVAGARIDTIEAPFDYDLVTAAWGTIMMTGLAWYLSKIPDWQDKVNPMAVVVAEDGATRTTGQLLDAMALALEVRRAAGKFFAQYDLLLCPATAALAWPADEIFPHQINGQPVGPRGHAVFTSWMNVVGVPAVTVPLTLTKDGGGIGLQLVAGHGRDCDLLEFVKSSEVFQQIPRVPLAQL